MNEGSAERAVRGTGFSARASNADAVRYGDGAEPRFRRGNPARDDEQERVRAASLGSGRPGERGLDVRRAKRLAAVAAASAAVAFASVAYGLWAHASSSAAVGAATSGAQPTLVAVADIRAGDALTEQTVRLEDVPAAFRSPAALGADALQQGSALGSRALVDIPAGSQITASFVTGSGGGRLAADLGAGMEAVTIGVDSETGLAGRIRVYDAVRVVSAEGASAGTSLLTTLCDSARVVAVGDEASAAGAPYTSVTVEVDPSQADAVREAQYAGKVSLVLLSAQDALGEGEAHG